MTMELVAITTLDFGTERYQVVDEEPVKQSGMTLCERSPNGQWAVTAGTLSFILWYLYPEEKKVRYVVSELYEVRPLSIAVSSSGQQIFVHYQKGDEHIVCRFVMRRVQASEQTKLQFDPSQTLSMTLQNQDTLPILHWEGNKLCIGQYTDLEGAFDQMKAVPTVIIPPPPHFSERTAVPSPLALQASRLYLTQSIGSLTLTRDNREWPLPLPLDGCKEHVGPSALSPDGLFAAAMTGAWQLCVWDLRVDTLSLYWHGTYQKQQGGALIVAISSNGRWLLIAEDAILTLYRNTGGRFMFYTTTDQPWGRPISNLDWDHGLLVVNTSTKKYYFTLHHP